MSLSTCKCCSNSTSQFSWEKSFRNLNINEMVSLFNKTMKNISNYIPHETIACDDKDPTWFNKNIKQLIQEKNNAYKSYILSDKNPQIFERVKSLQNQLKCSIEGNKRIYYLRISKKLMDSATSAKTYWSILKKLLHKKKFLVSLRSFIKVKMLQILKRNPNYLTLSLSNNVP